ncbi:MAG TPA: DUF397 domain-containing protein [Actinokineospora sp.]|jgi:hypothetical protein|nr:DUF397 domain-containing protein [Actinokineospora sp.]
MVNPAADLHGARWRKSTRSGGAQQCVEVADLHSARAVRDSKNITGPTLVFDHAIFATFLEGFRNNDH